MENKYDAKEAEPRIEKLWTTTGIFKFDPKSNKPVFSLDTPPPTISGQLHLGHAMSYTHFDFIARYKRMKGFNVLFPIGFDDNGQPTERFIEKKRNINLSTITKKEFVDIVKKDIKEVEEKYKNDFIRIGHSCDWNLIYRTIEDNCSKTAQFSFIDLYNKKLIYRSEEPTIWCTHCKTALSQADVEDNKRTTKLYHIEFDLEKKEKIMIATTRPEFLPACVGIFVHPNDVRYKKLVGKKATVPIFGQQVPIMKDERVDQTFGTGIVMICTFGDKTDIEWWKIHKLPLKIIVTKDGRIDSSIKNYGGLKLSEARKEILSELEVKGFVKKSEPLEQNVGVCWRCHEPVEFIVTKQWFVRIIDNKKRLLEQGRKIKWSPEYYIKRYEDWINNLNWDWLISRQRHHGIPIPVWYCKKCHEVILPEKNELPVNPQIEKPKKKCKCGSTDFIAEEDVFDTWMTSSLSPQIVLNWADDKKSMMKYMPEDLRPQAHDIIRTWAFYTIVKALYHSNTIPWKNIMISGHALDPKGKAMHKSTGNTIDPIEMINKYSADSLRFWAASTKLGEDVPFQEKELVSGQKTAVKLWNASKFVSMNLKDYKYKKIKKLHIIDKWLLSKLSKVIKQSEEAFEKYDYSVARSLVEQFFWKEFCDNYLEMIKHRIYANDDTAESAKYTLYESLLAILKLFAPFMPHITEELYQIYFRKEEEDLSIHISEWPTLDLVDEKIEMRGELAKNIITAVRQWKQQNKLPLNSDVTKVIIQTENIDDIVDDIKGAMKIKEIEIGDAKDISIEGTNIKLDITK